MRKVRISILTTVIILIFIIPVALAEVQWQISNTLSLEDTPLDTVTSTNGKRIFILTDAGKINIYNTTDGILQDVIDVGTHVDAIRTGPKEDILYLQSKEKKVVEILFLDFIHEFDLTGSPTKGPEDAPVTIVEFSDFQCAYCSRLTGQLDQVLKNNPKTVRVVFKHFPLSSHQYAVKAAMASMAAKADKKFWPFHDQLFKNYNRLNDKKIEEIAQSLEFNQETFTQKMKDPALLELIKRDYRQGIDAGVRGTPTLYINGKLVRDRSMDGIQTLIDNALKNPKKAP
jgi:protein-disulfide isomerase